MNQTLLLVIIIALVALSILGIAILITLCVAAKLSDEQMDRLTERIEDDEGKGLPCTTTETGQDDREQVD